MNEREYMQFRSDLRHRIRKLRLDRNWTLEKAEEQGTISWRHLQRIESGANFTIETLWRLCKLFKIKPADLFKRR